MRVQHFRSVRYGVERIPHGDLRRHYHREAYATIVLSGTFLEVSFSGRAFVKPGDVLLHGAFDAHANFSAGKKVKILRLPWTLFGPEGHSSVSDPDRLARVADTDPNEATELLAQSLSAIPMQPSNWIDRLARDLATDQDVQLHRWVENNGLAPETLSRGLRKAFGASPKMFRLEARTRAALRRVLTHTDALTEIAFQSGFADLADMNTQHCRNDGPLAFCLAEGQIHSAERYAGK